MPAVVERRWITGAGQAPGARLRLFCFPSGGGGASMYRPWMAAAPTALEVCPVQLPGRENRMAEPTFTRLEPLLEALTPAIQPYLDLPFAFFGHSMGALVSFELARQLRQEGENEPVMLFVSGLRAPQVPDRDAPIYALPDAEFIAEVRRYNGTPEEVLQHPELMQLMLPLLRADLAICDTYAYESQPPLACPISAFGGAGDPKVSQDELEAWRLQTASTFQMRVLPGDHFYLLGARAQVLAAVAGDLQALAVDG